MLHLTLNTGQVAEQSLDAIDKDVVELLRPLVSAGGGALPAQYGTFKVDITRVAGGGMFTINRGDGPLVTCGVAWTAAGVAEVWPEMERIYLQISDTLTGDRFNAEPREPDRLPWLAVVVHLSVYTMWLMNVPWLVEFQRCMAVALMNAKDE